MTPLADASVPNQVIFRKLQPSKSKGVVHVNLTNVPPGHYRFALRQTGFEKNDAYSAYLERNAPAQLTRAQEKLLRKAASGQPKLERAVKIAADGKFRKTLPLRENDVLLLTLTRQ